MAELVLAGFHRLQQMIGAMGYSAINEDLYKPKLLRYASGHKTRALLVFIVILLVFVFWRRRADAGIRPSNVVCSEGYSVSVFADGLASPDGLALNPDGVLYVAEEKAGRVSRVDANGSVTPVLRGLKNPEGITFDEQGNLYVVEDVSGGRVLKMRPQGNVIILATGRDAPEGVAWAQDGNLYFTESNVQFAKS